jgi:hypothetical protein
MNNTASTRVADAAAATSSLGWLASVATDTLPIFQLLAAVVAIVAGCFAIAYHYRRLQK